MLNISWRFRPLVLTLAGLLAWPGWLSAQPAAETDPTAEESPLLIEPESPEEAFEAAVLMQKLARPNLAKRYLRQLLDADPDDATLLELRDKHGPAVFLKLAKDEGLQPEGKTLMQKVDTAFKQRGADPQRINQLIDDLSAGPRKRAVAMDSLRGAGTVVVPHLIQRLKTAQGNEKTAVISALVKMGRQVMPPILGALKSPNIGVRGGAIEVLGYLGSEREAPYLWQPAFGPDEPPSIKQAARNALTKILKPAGRRTFQVTPYGAPARLKQAALKHYRGEYDWMRKSDEEAVTIWAWHPQTETVASLEMSPDEASLYRGAQLARDALILAPENEELQSLFIGFALARAIKRAGWDAALPTGPNTAFQYALTSGDDVVSKSLAQALENENTPAAVATLQVLAQIASRTQLLGQSANSPILRALEYPDSRVQFAAATTILQLDPNREFEGSRRVVQVLTRSLGDSGGPAVLVIDPNVSRANNVAGQFQQIGYRGQPLTEQTGQAGFKAAIERNDLELIAIQANVTDWTLSQTIANLRADSRTQKLPIVIYGPDWAEKNVQRLIRRTPRTLFALESETLDFFRQQVEPFLSREESEPLGEQERAAQASAAAYWLAQIASARRTDVFDISPAESALSGAIEKPNLAANAVQALGAIPSKTSQRRLQSVGVSDVYETSLRELAAIQLAFHIQRHALLLTSEQVREVESAIPAAGDPELASALASVTGSLDHSPAAVGKKLQEFPLDNPLAP